MKVIKTDVAVIGGGASGIAAALAASRMGAKTMLIERNPYFGGEATHASVTAFCGFFTRGSQPEQVVQGIGQEVLMNLKGHGACIEPTISKATGNASIRFDPELLKLTLDELLQKSNVDYRLHTQCAAVECEGSELVRIYCVDDEEMYQVEAKAYVDATGDANVVHQAKIKTRWGNEAGIPQMSSLAVRLEKLPAGSEIMPSLLEKAIQEGKKAGIPHLEKEKGMIIKILSEDYGYCTIPSLILSGLDGRTMTDAEMELRRQAFSYTEAFRRFMPGFEDVRIASTGPSIGIRQSRTIVGEKDLNETMVLQTQKTDDSVARGGWSPEIHKSNTELNYLHMEDNRYFSIPMGCLKVKDALNLWTCGRSISCDSVAHASIRVMGTGFATGQAAGTAAALSLQHEQPNVEEIQKALIQQGALI